MFRRISWLFAILFGLALAGATLMNLTLTSEARKALNESILADHSQAEALARHVALVIPDTRDSFFDGLIAGVQEAARGAQTAVQIFRYRSPDEEETFFQLSLSSRLDGVILYSGSDALMEARGQRAAAASVVFIPVGTQPPSKGSHHGFIGSSRLLQGIESGNQLTRRLGKAARIGLILASDSSLAPEADPLYQGVNVSLLSYPGSRIIRAVRAQPGILSGEEAASALLRAEPSVNVLVCASAPITEGAAQVVVDLGRVGQVLIVGTDESPAIARLVDKGVILASIVRDSRRMGLEAVEAFVEAKNGVPFAAAVEVGFSVRGRKVEAP